MKKSIVAIAIGLLIVLCFCTACSPTIYATELSANFTRTASLTGEVTNSFKSAFANFSFKLFNETLQKNEIKTEKNDVFSPLSAICCLALIANGASGQTKSQMEQVFGLDIDTLNKSLFAYDNSLYSGNDCKLNLANSIWFKEGDIDVNKSFLQTNADWYDAQAYAAPFDDTTIKDINNWCKKQTDGMIDEVLKDISKGAVMFLLNALCFDAKWAVKYEDGQVVDNYFLNYDNTQSAVKMLSSQENICLNTDGAVGFAKDYIDGKYSFAALLPDKKTDVYEFAKTLDGKKWLDMWQNKYSKSVDVLIPEFSYKSSIQLKEPLVKLGMADMFDSYAADFSALSTTQGRSIYCQFVKQDVFVELTRNGTKAAAVTIGGMTKSSVSSYSVMLNRPFVYGIVDNLTGLPLFLGVVNSL